MKNWNLKIEIEDERDICIERFLLFSYEEILIVVVIIIILFYKFYSSHLQFSPILNPIRRQD